MLGIQLAHRRQKLKRLFISNARRLGQIFDPLRVLRQPGMTMLLPAQLLCDFLQRAAKPAGKLRMFVRIALAESAKVLIHLRRPRPHGGKLRLQFLHRLRPNRRIPRVELLRDHLHRLFQLGESRPVVAEQDHAHIRDGGRNLVLQYTQSARRVARD